MAICPIITTFTSHSGFCPIHCWENDCALWNNGCAIARAADALTVLSEKNKSTSDTATPNHETGD